MSFSPFSVNVLFFAFYCPCKRVSQHILTIVARTAQITSIHNVAVAWLHLCFQAIPGHALELRWGECLNTFQFEQFSIHFACHEFPYLPMAAKLGVHLTSRLRKSTSFEKTHKF